MSIVHGRYKYFLFISKRFINTCDLNITDCIYTYMDCNVFVNDGCHLRYHPRHLVVTFT